MPVGIELPTGPTDAEVAWVAAWSDALDALELDVDTADELLRTAHQTPVRDVAAASAWRPPVGLGPLPASLEVRARALLGRQLETSRRIGQAMVVSRRQLAATRAMTFRSPESAVYFDDEV